jgi:tripartite-type tricarboxylate transporter receptor subunit TctC
MLRWVVLGLLLVQSQFVQAQTFPAGQITIVVPVAPGGLADLMARIAADYISTKTGQTVIVDNRAGAGGMIGMGAVARAKPDGYTLAMAINGDIVMNPYLHKHMPYDTLRDFIPVALVSEAPQILVVNSALPVKTLGEFIAYAKARPGKIVYGSTGIGSASHLGAYLLAKLAGLSLIHVPYRGGAPAINDLVAGHIQMLHISLGGVAGQVKAGTLRVLVVASPHRWDALPDVPSSTEAGLPGYVGSVWFGLFAPRGTPPAVVSRLNELMRAMTSDPTYAARIRAAHLNPQNETPEAFRSEIEKEAPVWKKIVAETGATAD